MKKMIRRDGIIGRLTRQNYNPVANQTGQGTYQDEISFLFLKQDSP